MRSLLINKLLSFQYRLGKLIGRRKAARICIVKPGEGILSLKPCAFYRGYPDMKKGCGQCKHGNFHAGCSGDYTYCENLEAVKKYFRKRGLGWHDWGKGNGTD
jgi:hypothetical protein